MQDHQTRARIVLTPGSSDATERTGVASLVRSLDGEELAFIEFSPANGGSKAHALGVLRAMITAYAVDVPDTDLLPFS
jgi:hypothetical protein